MSLDLSAAVIPPWVLPAVRIVLCVGLFVGGYMYRGDCAKEVRATEAVSTAKATVKAEKIATKTEVKNVQQQQRRTHITDAINALPPAVPPAPVVAAEGSPPACPAPRLSDSELRLWNAGNEDDDGGVQPPRVDSARPAEAPAPAKP